MTLCSDCATRHGAEIEFAAVIIDAEIAGRRTSQASTDLRAMLPPVLRDTESSDARTGDTDE